MANNISPEAIERRKYWVAEIAKLSGNFADDFERLTAELKAEVEKGGVQVLIDHVRLCGSIPEIYGHDSSEEKLYSKYTDLLLAMVFDHIGLKSVVVTERADAADVDIEANGYSFVADAKAFRLSRTAKNAKDFKVDSMHKWKNGKEHAMVVCPIYQLPRNSSQIYRVATTSDVCIFTYSHLALLLTYAEKGGKEKARELLANIFKCVKQETPTKEAKDYWTPVNGTILKFDDQIKELWDVEKKASLEAIKIGKDEDIALLTTKKASIDKMTLDEAKAELVKVYGIENKTKLINAVDDNGLFDIK
jgi:hypothetical protein